MAYQILKCKEPRTVAEDFTKPCTEEIIETMIMDQGQNTRYCKFRCNGTIRRRLDDMCASEFALKSRKATLIVFAQYKKEEKMKKEFMFCNIMSTTAPARESYYGLIFKVPH